MRAIQRLTHGRPDAPFSAFGIAVIIATIAVDQATKQLAEALLPFGRANDMLPFLAFYRTYNTGIAFSLFRGSGPAVLIAVTLGILVFVLALWARAHEGGRLAAAGYALIVGGALGNLLDRALHGHVIDFLLLHTGPRTLFVFNLADVALTAGPLLLIGVFLLGGRGHPHPPRGDG